MNLQGVSCTKEMVKEFANLNQREKETIFSEIEQIYNAFGQLLVYDYLESAEYKAQNWQMADGINPDIVEAEILNNPFRVRIFVKQIPEHSRVYARSKFLKEAGFSRERQRWILIMHTAFSELKKLGLQPFQEKMIAVYKFYFMKTADSDNYIVRFPNNAIRDVGLIKDDSVKYLATFLDGKVKPEKPGVEITLLQEEDFGDFYQKFMCEKPL